jgi:hypothetical protein
LFTRFYDLEGKEEFNRLSERGKRTQTIVPGLVSNHHLVDSAIHTNPPSQMWEIKRIHALLAPNLISGLPVRLNEYCRLRQTGRLVKGADRRETRVSFEYKNNGRARRSSTFDAQRVPPRATTWHHYK